MTTPVGGALPAGWSAMPLRRVAICRDDLRAPVNAEERAGRPGDIPYWGANSVQGTIDEALVRDPVVLLGEDGAPFFETDRPVAFYVDEPIWPNNHIHVLMPRSGVHGPWLAYALNAVDYSLVITGSTRDKLTQGAMLGISLAVPPTNEQRSIADFLNDQTSRIDTLIDAQTRFINTLRERRRGIREELAARVGVGDRLKWRLVEVDERAGGRADELPLMSVSIDWGVRRRDAVTSDKHRADDLAIYKVCAAGDIVVNRMRAFQGALGVAPEQGLVSPDYAVLRTRSAGVSGNWMAEVMRTSAFIGEMVVRIRGIGGIDSGSVRTPRINVADLLDIRVAATPAPEQERELVSLAGRSARVDVMIDKTEQHIALAKERRAALVTGAVSGQIDVRTAGRTA